MYHPAPTKQNTGDMQTSNQQPAEENSQPIYKTIGMVARWRPVHNGHAAVLRAICGQAEKVIIGIGSANVYNYRNPFTLEETKDMLHLALAGWHNYTLIGVDDLNDGPKWRDLVAGLFGELDLFLTDNPYVYSLMKDVYPTEKPVTLVREEERTPITGTMVRLEMARGGNWQEMVPKNVAAYIEKNELDKRFKNEFGLQTLALGSIIQERSNS